MHRRRVFHALNDLKADRVEHIDTLHCLGDNPREHILSPRNALGFEVPNLIHWHCHRGPLRPRPNKTSSGQVTGRK